jgi:hypothetical protein
MQMKRRKKMNEYLKNLKTDNNYGFTENGGVKHNTTMSNILDRFAMGGAMRKRSDDDIITMFKQAYAEDHTLALRCLFYLRDVRGGQGERRFFRTVFKWMGDNLCEECENLIPLVSEYGRWDDLFELFGTKCEGAMMGYVMYAINMNKDHLLYKWMPSINASSHNTQERGRKFAREFSLTERQYRKMLSEGRKACNLVETLMSQWKWDQIAFDKLPSRAGLLYKNAFMRREETKDRYAKFMQSDKTRVNAAVLNPVDIAHQIFGYRYRTPDTVERLAWQKYWDNLKDYYDGREEPGIAVVDVSGSMWGVPLEAAVSMGAYIAERGKGPFQNHFITFSDDPKLVEFKGTDIYDKFIRARDAEWGGSTNIEAVFNMLLDTALKHHTPASDMPKTLYIFSDMEFNGCITSGPAVADTWGWSYGRRSLSEGQINTVIEAQAKVWKQYGYEIPRVIFWNLDARHENIPAIGPGFSYVSGFNMNMVECILSGKDGMDLCLEKLNSPRYENIRSLFV